ncbi:MAG: 4a-hydroxytetrahydrobiopterin dehydratase [Chloroflexota bacterium]
MTRKALTEEELAEVLTTLDGWTINAGKLHKTFKFANFKEAMGWMVAVGMVAEKMDHHPEWSNVYSRVTVNLVTHDLGNKIGTWDVELAREMNQLAD